MKITFCNSKKNAVEQTSLAELTEVTKQLSLPLDDEKMFVDERFLMMEQRHAKELFDCASYTKTFEDNV